MTWSTGTAEVIATTAFGLTVKCPHCGGQHRHGRGTIGSNHVVAGCHAGFTRCREYKVVDYGGKRR